MTKYLFLLSICEYEYFITYVPTHLLVGMYFTGKYYILILENWEICLEPIFIT